MAKKPNQPANQKKPNKKPPNKPRKHSLKPKLTKQKGRKILYRMVGQRLDFRYRVSFRYWRYFYLNLCIIYFFSLAIPLYSTFWKILSTGFTLEKVLHLSV